MSKKHYTIDDISPFLPKNSTVVSNIQVPISITSVGQTLLADNMELTFIDSKRADKQELYEKSNAGIIICDNEIVDKPKDYQQTIIKVDLPKLVFSIVANALFVNRPTYGIHPTAFIHPEADIHVNSHIGAFSYIGKCKIGEGTIIYGNCHFYDKVEIGRNAIIHAGVVLGADGYGYNRDHEGFPVQFPHLGSIVIEDFVEIGANTAIDMGALGATRIKYASKVDNLVHIGHNVEVGRCCYVAANTSIAGSTIVDDYSEIWMGSSIADGLKVGKRSSIGIGSTVIRDVDEKKKVFGNPARVISS
jgi:UDP-3-O-[3-hydroxymyristoyl] glucosamine N-acyltransferase